VLPTTPPLPLVTEADALLLFLRALIPNKIATRPIKNPVVAAYINIASAMMHTYFTLTIMLYDDIILYSDIIVKCYWNVSSKSLSAPIA
jgi:hypothetical protein